MMVIDDSDASSDSYPVTLVRMEGGSWAHLEKSDCLNGRQTVPAANKEPELALMTTPGLFTAALTSALLP